MAFCIEELVCQKWREGCTSVYPLKCPPGAFVIIWIEAGPLSCGCRLIVTGIGLMVCDDKGADPLRKGHKAMTITASGIWAIWTVDIVPVWQLDKD